MELLEFVDDVVDALGSRKDIEHIYKILERGTDADRQRLVYKESGGDCKAIVDDLIARTMLGVEEGTKAGEVTSGSAAKTGE